MRGQVIAALRSAVDLVLPPRCLACGEIVPADGSFCADCWGSLRFVTAPMCARCSLPFELPATADALCGACMAAPPRYGPRAAVAYDGAARDVVLGLKHSDREHLAGAMARHLMRVGSEWLGDGALVVPVPLHRWRLWRRGYNQAALLARAVAKLGDAELAVDALERVKPTPPSRDMNRSQRAANVRGAFRVRPGAKALLEGRAVLLVDDVLTTGATAVNLLTWARVVRPSA